MAVLTAIIDPSTGDLTLEGVGPGEATALLEGAYPEPEEVNCARPLQGVPLPAFYAMRGEPVFRVHRVYHGSVVEGPGRRSVLQLQGCPIRCAGCFVPETHDSTAGVSLGMAQVLDVLLDPSGEPRDGVTITGGEPFAQAFAVSQLVHALKDRGIHVVVYSGYGYRQLRRWRHWWTRAIVRSADMLITGSFQAGLQEGAGEWRGSVNQEVIVGGRKA